MDNVLSQTAKARGAQSHAATAMGGGIDADKERLDGIKVYPCLGAKGIQMGTRNVCTGASLANVLAWG